MRVTIAVFEAPEKTVKLRPKTKFHACFGFTNTARARTWDEQTNPDEVPSCKLMP